MPALPEPQLRPPWTNRQPRGPLAQVGHGEHAVEEGLIVLGVAREQGLEEACLAAECGIEAGRADRHGPGQFRQGRALIAAPIHK
jgi:hypothetical protein